MELDITIALCQVVGPFHLVSASRSGRPGFSRGRQQARCWVKFREYLPFGDGTRAVCYLRVSSQTESSKLSFIGCTLRTDFETADILPDVGYDTREFMAGSHGHDTSRADLAALSRALRRGALITTQYRCENRALVCLQKNPRIIARSIGSLEQTWTSARAPCLGRPTIPSERFRQRCLAAVC
jgi:hypothetical protein